MPKKSVTTQEIINSIVENDYYSKRMVYNNENDKFLWYDDNNNYIYLDDKEFATFLFAFLEEFYPDVNVSKHFFGEVKYFLRIKLPRQIYNEHEEYLAFNDKLFNLNKFEPEEKDTSIVTTFNIPFNYEEIVKCETPRFDSFLREVFIDDDGNPDEGLIELVQEMCGSFLVPDMECSQAWFWVGEGGNGKSVFSKIIQKIFPERILSSMNLQTMTTNRWAMDHLVGKRLNISAEEESKYISSDKFKALVFGDTVHAEEKYGGSYQFQPKAKFIFLTNNMPSLGSIDLGLKRRIQIIPFKKKFSDKEKDPFLINQLEQELPGIVYWMLEGARRIVKKNYLFEKPQAAEKAMEKFVLESNSSIEFIKENYVYDPDGKAPVNELYQAYKEWCANNGRKPLSKNNFLKDIRREMEIDVKRMRMNNTLSQGLNLILKDNSYGEDKDELPEF